MILTENEFKQRLGLTPFDSEKAMQCPPPNGPAYKPSDLISKKDLLEKIDSYGCPKERATYLFKALRRIVEEA